MAHNASDMSMEKENESMVNLDGDAIMRRAQESMMTDGETDQSLGEEPPVFLKLSIASKFKSILAKGSELARKEEAQKKELIVNQLNTVMEKISTPVPVPPPNQTTPSASSTFGTPKSTPLSSSTFIQNVKYRSGYGTGRTCAALGCTTNQRDGGKFHAVPYKDEKRCKLWLNNCGRYDLLRRPFEKLKNFAVCKEHFKPSDYECNGRYLKKDAVPTLFKFKGGRRTLIREMPKKMEFKATPEKLAALHVPCRYKELQYQAKIAQLRKKLNDVRKQKSPTVLVDEALRGKLPPFLYEVVSYHLREPKKGKRKMQYWSSIVRDFALGISKFGKTPYKFVRSYIPLPTRRTVTRWRSKARADAGLPPFQPQPKASPAKKRTSSKSKAKAKAEHTQIFVEPQDPHLLANEMLQATQHPHHSQSQPGEVREVDTAAHELLSTMFY